MSKSKQKLAVAGTASLLATFALAGTAFAGDVKEKSHDASAAELKTHTAAEHKAKGPAGDDVREIATAFGVEQLNDIEDWKIMNGAEEIGEIDRLGVDAETGELLAIVGLEGVVGVNMKEVAVPLRKLHKAGDETLSTDLTKLQLQQERDIDPWDGSYTQVIKDETAEAE